MLFGRLPRRRLLLSFLSLNETYSSFNDSNPEMVLGIEPVMRLKLRSLGYFVKHDFQT
jgi:hypothetical protein